jgi:hypothetical protein
VSVNKTRLLRRGRRWPPRPGREHVRFVTRLLVAQAGVVAAVSLPFSRRSTPVIVTTLMFVAALCILAVLAQTGTPAARTAVLGFELAVIVFGLYRFFFERYLGGTIFAIVLTAVLLHPAVARAYGAEPAGSAEPVEPGGTLSESARR